MKIFGYQKGEEVLLEMKEIAIQCAPEDLDDLIGFLTSARSSMADHGADFGHEHFSDWRRKNGGSVRGEVDIIVSG